MVLRPMKESTRGSYRKPIQDSREEKLLLTRGSQERKKKWIQKPPRPGSGLSHGFSLRGRRALASVGSPSPLRRLYWPTRQPSRPAPDGAGSLMPFWATEALPASAPIAAWLSRPSQSGLSRRLDSVLLLLARGRPPGQCPLSR